MKDSRIDRLYELLPVIYRMRDAEQGEPLKALLQIISEQVNLVEDDIQQLYENWFIETCEDWVVPYLAELIGYEPLHEAGEPSPGITTQGQLRNKILIPRREVANTIRYRRRKGTLALLELLANDIAGWPARAVEFHKLLAKTQSINHLQLARGKTLDIRDGSALELLDSPFDKAAHTVDIRRINSHHTQGRYNIPSVGIFIWRLKTYSITGTSAYCMETPGSYCFTFSVLGNDTPLNNHPEPEQDPSHIAEQFNLPIPISRALFDANKAQYYGKDKSIYIVKGAKKIPVKIEDIVVADLSDWQYLPRRGKVAVDPELGRIVFAKQSCPKTGVWVNYQYSFSADLGGGEYDRPISQPKNSTTYYVGKDEQYKTIDAALLQWKKDKKEHSVIEINDNGVYVDQVNIDCELDEDEGNASAGLRKMKSLQIRAANRKRPVIKLLDRQASRPDSMTINGDCVECFILDGILVTGRGIQVNGDLTDLIIRHSTLVPGWTLDGNCKPNKITEPSLEVFSPNACIKIEHSIVGSIQIDPEIEFHLDETQQQENAILTEEDANVSRCQGIGSAGRLDPIRLCISDSILDATDPEIEVIGAPGCPVAHTCLTIQRTTVFGYTQVHAIELAENTIFDGRITVARRQKGCMRFCYVTPESRTPKRYRCQPDLVTTEIEQKLLKEADANDEPKPDDLIIIAAKQQESLRTHPIFNSVRYGTPTYGQLADCCAEEIKHGADDESEMGVFHNLYQPQRMANLHVRLDEYLPARMDVGIIVSS